MAILEVENRHPGIKAAARRYEVDHLTNPDARQVGIAFARLASEMLARIKTNDPEVTRGLTLLADSRDAFMRAVVYQGQPVQTSFVQGELPVRLQPDDDQTARQTPYSGD